MYDSGGMLKHRRYGIALTVRQWRIVVSNIENVNACLKKRNQQTRPLKTLSRAMSVEQESIEVKKEAITEVKEETESFTETEVSDAGQAMNYSQFDKDENDFPYITVLSE